MHAASEGSSARSRGLLCALPLFATLLLAFGCRPVLLNQSRRFFCYGDPRTFDGLGGGTRANPYLLCNATQFLSFLRTPAAWSKSYMLKTDVDLGGISVAPIGSASTPFTGFFDGTGHTISNFSYSAATTDNIGFFGVIKGARAEVRRLVLANFTVVGRDYVGGVVGRLQRGKLLGITFSGSVTGRAQVGGLAGEISDGGIVSASSSSASVSGNPANTNHGGLVGSLNGGGAGVINSYNTGGTAGGTNIGGAVGGCVYGMIHNVYVSGNVTGVTSASPNAGGILGFETRCWLQNVFSAGTTTADPMGNNNVVGPVVGFQQSSARENAAYYVNPCVTAPGGGTCNTTLPPANLVATSTLYSPTNPPLSSWNFGAMWVARANGFPTLAPLYFDRLQNWSGCAGMSGAPFAAGYGTVEFPYILCTAAQFMALNSNASYWPKMNAFQLAADIDLSGVSGLVPLGNAAINDNIIFNGDGYVIRNGSVSGATGAGFFGVLTAGATVRLLGLENISVVGAGAGAGGFLYQGTYGYSVMSSYIRSSSVNCAGTSACGGFIGSTSFGAFLDSWTNASVTNGTTNVGGFFGSNLAVVGMTGLFASGSVAGSSAGANTVGPFVGSGASGGSYYGTNSSCSDSSSTVPPTCQAPLGTAAGAISDFYDPALPPLNQWDFNWDWQAQAGDYPRLRKADEI